MKEQNSENHRDEKDKGRKPNVRETLEERKRHLDGYIINSHEEKIAEKSKPKREEYREASTVSNGRRVLSTEKKMEEKENIPRPRSRNIEKVIENVHYGSHELDYNNN